MFYELQRVKRYRRWKRPFARTALIVLAVIGLPALVIELLTELGADVIHEWGQR